MKKITKNKRKISIIISILFIIILVICIMANYLKSNKEITSFAGSGINLMNANIVQKTVGGLESAYIEWENVDNATGYNVYIYDESSNNYKQLDNELIRQYKDGTSTYWRADAVGLKAGKYKFQIVPIIEGEKAENKKFESQSIDVEMHDRTGFAWVDGETTGAYNMDGTLKENAKVLYISEDTKDTITLDVTTSSNGKKETAQGLQNILDIYI